MGSNDPGQEEARRRSLIPRGRVGVGSAVGTAVGLTSLLSWIGIHPGSSPSNNTTGAHPTESAIVSQAVSTRTPGFVAATPSPSGATVVVPQFSFAPRAHPAITLSPDSGGVGSSFTVSGAGFPADATVDISMQAMNVGTAHSDGSGSFRTTVRVPEFFRGFEGQRFSVEAVARDTASSTQAYFTVTG